MHKKITILCDAPIRIKPRPARLLEILQKYFEVSVINADSFSPATPQSPKILAYQKDKTRAQRTDEQNEQILNFCINSEFDKLIFTPNRTRIFELFTQLDAQSTTPQDLLIVEDITLLPFALAYKKQHENKPKILIDLREFYPLEYENSAQWLATFGRFFAFLCAHYLPQVDYALCVSQSILERYQRDFGVKGELYLSLPPRFDSSFNPPHLDTRANFQNLNSENPQTRKILYHGFISHDRDSENLLELARILSRSHAQNFRIYAMVLSNDPDFLQQLKSDALDLNNFEFLPPVELQQIIPFSTRFDIGLIPFAPTTYNLAHCMPNKFFEYIQAGLCVVSTPLVEISHFLQEHKCGFCATDFGARSLADALISLDSENLRIYKQKARDVAKIFNADQNERKIIKIINALI